MLKEILVPFFFLKHRPASFESTATEYNATILLHHAPADPFQERKAQRLKEKKKKDLKYQIKTFG